MLSGQKLVLVIATITMSAFGAKSQDVDSLKSNLSNLNKVSFQDFNRGNIHNVYDAINGRFPGVLISKPGSNPNQLSDMLVRGIGTENANRFPLIVVDGVIGASIEGLDLNDIASVELLKGAETARYGVQGGSGVLEITTKSFEGNGSRILVNAFTAADFRTQNMKPATAQDFLDLRGNDLGTETDWIDVITSTALTQVVNLTAEGQANKLNYRVSGNTRLVNGILDNSGFDRFNFFGKVNYQLSAKLDVTYFGSVTRDNRSIGFEEAFKDAFQQNPTQPVFFENGNLYQGIAFDYYNPLGYIDFISRTSDDWTNIHNLNFNFDLANSTIALTGGFTNRETDFLDQYNSDFMFGVFRGVPERRAEATRTESFNARLNWKKDLKTWKKWEYQTELGVNFQRIDREQINRFSFNQDIRTNAVEYNIDFFSPDASFSGTYNRWLDVSAYYRYENATALGDNEEGNGFSAFSVSAQLDSVFSFMKGFSLHASAGRSGTIINQDTQYSFGNPQFVEPMDRQNQNLTYERNINREIGLTYQPSGKNYFFSATRFLRRSEGIIEEIFDRDDRGSVIAGTQMQENLSDLENRGWEFAAGIEISDYYRKWRSRLTVTSLTTEWLDTPFNNREASFLPMTNRRPSRTVIGEAYNVFYAPIVLNIENDVYTFLDADQSGDIDIFFDDLVPVGQPLPQYWMSWTNDIEWGKNKVSFMVESMLGHSTVNSVRRRRGIVAILGGTVNVTQEDLRLDAFSNNYADIFVEESSFVRFRFVSYERRFKIKERDFSAYVVGNNLLTLTSFNGNDPTPQLSGDSPSIVTQMGVETMNRWLPARSVVLGFSVNF